MAKSLDGEQAKVWIVESAVEEQLTGSPPISFAEWEFNEPDGQGLRAPVGTQLEIKGAWIDQSRNVVFNELKRPGTPVRQKPAAAARASAGQEAREVMPGDTSLPSAIMQTWDRRAA